MLSLGPRIPLPLTGTTVPGPWSLLAGLPLFESVIESRVALVCAPALGMLLALAIDRLAQARRLGTSTPDCSPSASPCSPSSRPR